MAKGTIWLTDGQSMTIPIPTPTVPSTWGTALGLPGPTLIATMCYTDVAGIRGRGETINKVTFRVEAGTSGDLRYGNTGATTPDLDNNVQKVIWDNIPLGGAVSPVIHCTFLQPGGGQRNHGEPDRCARLCPRLEMGNVAGASNRASYLKAENAN